MCAIVGCYLETTTPKKIQILKNLFIQSQIRGRHQTGIVYESNGKLERFVVEGDGRELVSQFDWDKLREQPTIKLIGHNRYSTSDLNYPQPLQVFDDLALVHNGVVDQRPPDQWGQYGYDLTTANDSELLYHARYEGWEPLEEFPDATIAAAELHANGDMRWYRNAGRPLYYDKFGANYYICSTKDIALRSGLTNARRCRPGMVYTLKGKSRLMTIQEMIP